MSAIGFLNHDLDVAKLGELADEDLTAVQTDFYTLIGQLCRENPHNLLAGVVEEALLRAFTIIDPDAEKE